MPFSGGFGQFGGAPFWDKNPEGYEENAGAIDNPWDMLFLDGWRIPGVVESITVTPKLLIHCSKRTGGDGGPTTERGHEAARVEIVQKLWTPEQWKKWQAIKAVIWRTPGQKFRTKDATKTQAATGAVAINHPACIDARIFAVLFEGITSAEPCKEIGARVVKMRAVQFIPGGDQKKPAKAYVPVATGAGGAAVQTGVPARPQSETGVDATPDPETP